MSSRLLAAKSRKQAQKKKQDWTGSQDGEGSTGLGNQDFHQVNYFYPVILSSLLFVEAMTAAGDFVHYLG